jgi:hypothetical protein
MRRLFFLLGVLLAGNCILAQQKPTDLDKSPMDVSYYPPNYPIAKMKGQVGGDPLARIIYSRPQKKGREIFGEEVKYGEVWRLGANEATEIELFKSGTIGGKKIQKGRYTIYCIPTEAKWTIAINKDNYSWGSFTYKQEKDVARIDVPIQKNAENVEALTMYFDNNSWVIEWENLKATIPVAF